MRSILCPAETLGIGTTAAAAFKLQVAGDVGPNVDITYNLGSASLRWNNLYVNSILGPGALWTASGTHIYNSNSGNVGIGVTSPTGSKLQVAGFVSGSDGTSFATKWSGDNHHGIWYRAAVSADGSTVSVADAITYREYGSSSLGHHFWTGGTTQTERFRITNDYASFITGNVGVGTTAPGAKLHVSSGDASYALFGPNATWSSYLYVGAGGSTISAGRAQVISTNGNLHLDAGVGQNIYIANYNGSNTFMQTGGGNVGISTTLPGSKLDVQGGHLTVGTLYGSNVMYGNLGSFDTRGTNPNPETYYMGTVSEFKANTSNGLSDGGSYNSVFTTRQWSGGTDWSGGGTHQLSFTQKGNIWQRYSETTGSWGAWKKILDSGNISGNINGTTNYVAKFTGANTIGNSQVFDNGSNVAIGHAVPNRKLDIGNGSDGITIGQQVDNTQTIQTYIDGQWAARTTYASGCCNKLLLQPDIGEVGIGNAAPQHLLSVGAATADTQLVTIRGYSNSPASWKGGGAFGYTSAAVIMGELSGVAQLGGHSSTLNAWATLAINSAGGNVGIGNSGPTAKFHVTGATRHTGDIEIDGGNTLYFGREESFGGGDVGGADYGFIRWDNDNNTYNRWGDSGENGALVIGSQNDGANTVSDIVVMNGIAANIFDAGSGINYFTGNVGIGTWNPNNKLDIYTTGANGDGAVFAPAITADNNFTIQTYIDANLGGGGWAGRVGYAGGCCNNLALQPDIGTVSIGGTSSNYGEKFTVNGTARFTGVTYHQGTAYFGGSSQSYIDGNQFAHANGRILLSGNLHIDSYNGNAIYENYYTSNNIYQVVGGGRVGVSTTGPAAQFHVWGNATTAAIVSSGGSYYTDWPGGWGGGLAAWDLCIASVRYSGTQTRSDIRLKKDVTTMSETLSAVETLNKLRPVTYHWIDERLPKNLRYGFIAQEIEKVLPELVDVGTDTMKTLAVNYEDIIPILTLAIQEQQKEIEELKSGTTTSAENIELKSEIAELRKMVLELQQQQKSPK